MKTKKSYLVTKISRIILKLTLVIFSCVTALSILEISLHLLPVDIVQDEEQWTFVNNPLHYYFSLDSDRIYKISSNKRYRWNPERESDEYGFRLNPSHFGKDRNNDKRIVVVGDSFTFGHGVEHNKTYPYLLEQRLNYLGYNVWVDNAGVPGYGLDQEFIYIRDEIIPKQKPSLIIWSFNHNDFGDSNDACLFRKIGKNYYQLSGRLNSLYFKKAYFSKLPIGLRNSRLFSFVNSRIPERFTVGCTRNNIDWDEIAAKMEFFLNEASTLAKKHNIFLLAYVVLNEHFFALNPDTNDWQSRVEQNREIGRLFIETAKRARIPVVDTNSQIVFDSEKVSHVLGYSVDDSQSGLFLEKDTFPVGWRHTSKEGNELMSNIVADTLIMTALKYLK